MTVSVHDNWLYALAVDHQRRRVVLHTVFPQVEPWEYTDVVFTGVVTHHFERQNLGDDGQGPANVLFDVEEVTDPLGFLGEYEDLLARTKNWGWPTHKYESLDDLVAQLTGTGAKGFAVVGTWGLHGFVFARKMELRPRGARAAVAD